MHNLLTQLKMLRNYLRSDSMTPLILVGLAIMIVAAFITVFFFVTEDLSLKTDAATAIPLALGLLIFIALIVERAVEVFVGIFRSVGQERVKVNLDDAKDAGNKQVELTAQRALNRYKRHTMVIAMTTALVLGLLVASVGLRVLQLVVVIPEAGTGSNEISTMQASWIRFADVALTGGLIAGGSDGIHKVTNVFTKFMESRAQ